MIKPNLRAWPLLVGAVAGAAAGALAFGATRLSEPVLWTGLGALIGGCAPFLSRRFRGAVRITEVTVHVPQFSDLKFVVDDEAKLVAWRLYVEVSTRISTQPLASDDGLVREALSSLYHLFASTRETLKASRPSTRMAPDEPSVEHLAMAMLNRELRPFLSRWHPRLKEYELAQPGAPESAWPFNARCRAELAQVSINTLEYAFAFASLSGVRDPEAVLGPLPASSRPTPAPLTTVPAPTASPAPIAPAAIIPPDPTVQGAEG